jgi:hypothetical protein
MQIPPKCAITRAIPATARGRCGLIRRKPSDELGYARHRIERPKCRAIDTLHGIPCKDERLGPELLRRDRGPL